jgi:membrane protease YdiL (CAAX protease family)
MEVKREWLVLVLAMLLPAVLSYLYCVALEQHQTDGEPTAGPNRAAQTAWVGGKIVQFSIPLLWLAFIRRPTGKAEVPPPRSVRVQGWVATAVFSLFVAGTALLLYYLVLRHGSLMREAPTRVRAKLDEFGLQSPLAFLGFVAFIVVVHSLLEEYYWRWFVFGRLRHHLPTAAAIALSSAAFGGFHIFDLAMYFPGKVLTLAVPLGICVGIGGAVWCWLYQRTGTIVAPWLSHLLIDAAVILIVGYDLAFLVAA